MRAKIFLLALLLLATGLTMRVQAAEFTGQVVQANHGGAPAAVVYLEGGAKSSPLTHAMVDQRDKMFLPHVSVITRGTTVRFPNDDTVFHNVFAYFQAKKFDLGMYPRGSSKQVTFDKAGLVVLLCNVHSDMGAYIMVVDTPYYAVADKQGRFHISNVPAGTYTLHAWHESGGVSTQAVSVGSGRASATISLTRG